MLGLDTLPDIAKYTIGIGLIVLGTFGGFIVQDTWREPHQRSNMVLRRVAYFWIETAPEIFQIGAVTRIYNLGSRPTLLRGVSIAAATPQWIGRGQTILRRYVVFDPTAEVTDDNFVKGESDALYKVLLPIRFEATIMHPPPFAIAYVGTWRLNLRSGTRDVQPEFSGTFDRVITITEWGALLTSASTISPDSIHYDKSALVN